MTTMPSLPLLALLAALVPLPSLSTTTPTEVPSGEAVAGWERLGGEAKRANGERIAYELLVDPKRLGLYTITRYRVRLAGSERPQNEILIWNARPGTREPVRCFEHVTESGAAASRSHWQPVVHATEPYRIAMYRAMEVYVLHRRNEIAAEENARRERGD